MSWLLLPVMAWHPAPIWWAGLASLFVIALGLLQPPQRSGGPFGWLLLGCLGIYLLHAFQPYGTQRGWMAYVLAFLVSAALIAERGEWAWLRQAVLVCAWMQLPIIGLQWLHVSLPWPEIGAGLHGTLGRRWALSTWLAVASLWSSGRSAWVLGLVANLTGSLMGVPALVRLCWRWRLARWAMLGLGLALSGVWGPRVLLRWDAWQGAGFLPGGWLTGWGFLPLPGGVAYDGGGVSTAPFIISDYHSTLLDWIARGGLLAAILVGAAGVWVVRRSRLAWQRWTLVLAGGVGCWQSLEAAPVLILVMLAWGVGLAQGGGSHAVDTL